MEELWTNSTTKEETEKVLSNTDQRNNIFQVISHRNLETLRISETKEIQLFQKENCKMQGNG